MINEIQEKPKALTCYSTELYNRVGERVAEISEVLPAEVRYTRHAFVKMAIRRALELPIEEVLQ